MRWADRCAGRSSRAGRPRSRSRGPPTLRWTRGRASSRHPRSLRPWWKSSRASRRGPLTSGRAITWRIFDVGTPSAALGSRRSRHPELDQGWRAAVRTTLGINLGLLVWAVCCPRGGRSSQPRLPSSACWNSSIACRVTRSSRVVSAALAGGTKRVHTPMPTSGRKDTVGRRQADPFGNPARTGGILLKTEPALGGQEAPDLKRPRGAGGAAGRVRHKKVGPHASEIDVRAHPRRWVAEQATA